MTSKTERDCEGNKSNHSSKSSNNLSSISSLTQNGSTTGNIQPSSSCPFHRNGNHQTNKTRIVDLLPSSSSASLGVVGNLAQQQPPLTPKLVGTWTSDEDDNLLDSIIRERVLTLAGCNTDEEALGSEKDIEKSNNSMEDWELINWVLVSEIILSHKTAVECLIRYLKLKKRE